MQVGSIVKYYGDIGIVLEVNDSVRFPNNQKCQEAIVLFSDGRVTQKTMGLHTDLPQLELVCR